MKPQMRLPKHRLVTMASNHDLRNDPTIHPAWQFRHTALLAVSTGFPPKQRTLWPVGKKNSFQTAEQRCKRIECGTASLKL